MMEVQNNPELIRTDFRHLQAKEKSFILQFLTLSHAKHQRIKEKSLSGLWKQI